MLCDAYDGLAGVGPLVRASVGIRADVDGLLQNQRVCSMLADAALGLLFATHVDVESGSNLDDEVSAPPSCSLLFEG